MDFSIVPDKDAIFETIRYWLITWLGGVAYFFIWYILLSCFKLALYLALIYEPIVVLVDLAETTLEAILARWGEGVVSE